VAEFSVTRFTSLRLSKIGWVVSDSTQLGEINFCCFIIKKKRICAFQLFSSMITENTFETLRSTFFKSL